MKTIPPFLSESQRYEYPSLSPSSTVIDGGCYHGQWAVGILQRYNCRVIGFEPVGKFLAIADGALRPWWPSSRVVQQALGGFRRKLKLHIQNDSSGAFAGSEEIEDAEVFDVRDLFKRFGLHHVDLLKLNIEGMEYETLESLIISAVTRKFVNIQVQFHTNAPDYLVRHALIHKALAVTHDCTWHTDFVWTNWTLKT